MCRPTRPRCRVVERRPRPAAFVVCGRGPHRCEAHQAIKPRTSQIQGVQHVVRRLILRKVDSVAVADPQTGKGRSIPSLEEVRGPPCPLLRPADLSLTETSAVGAFFGILTDMSPSRPALPLLLQHCLVDAASLSLCAQLKASFKSSPDLLRDPSRPSPPSPRVRHSLRQVDSGQTRF